MWGCLNRQHRHTADARLQLGHRQNPPLSLPQTLLSQSKCFEILGRVKEALLLPRLKQRQSSLGERGRSRSLLSLEKQEETLPDPGSCSDTKHRSATAGGAKGPMSDLDTEQHLAAGRGKSRTVDNVPSLRSRCRVVLVAQSCLTLCDPVDCRPPGSSVHGIPKQEC